MTPWGQGVIIGAQGKESPVQPYQELIWEIPGKMKTSRLGALLAGPAKAKGKEKVKEVTMRRVFLLSFLLLLAAASACQGAPTPSPTPARSPTAAPTLAATYTPPVNPVISQFRVQDALSDALTIIWWTDRPTTGRLEYGRSDQYGLSTPWSEGLNTSNGATVTGLEQGDFHFRVRVKDAAGNETVTRVFVLTVLPMDYEDPWVYVEDLL